MKITKDMLMEAVYDLAEDIGRYLYEKGFDIDIPENITLQKACEILQEDVEHIITGLYKLL